MSRIKPLLTVLEVVRQNAPLDVANWFCDGIDQYMKECGSLDRCLDLIPQQGSPHPAKAYQTWKRNNHLITAHQYCKGETGWEKSKDLSIQAKKFEALTWPYIKDRESPKDHWSDLKKELFFAYRCGRGIPNQRQIHDIVQSHTLSVRIDILSIKW